MKWIDKNVRMPDKHPIFEGCSMDVMVTDGVNWGHGKYDYDSKRWVYVFVGQYECNDNEITNWAEPPTLPTENKKNN